MNLLGFGTTLGVMAQALILIPALRKSGYTLSALTFNSEMLETAKLEILQSGRLDLYLVNQITFLMVSNLTTLANVLVAGDPSTVAVGFTSYQKGPTHDDVAAFNNYSFGNYCIIASI
jgi:putative peptidoglycan lipid II flippase